VTRLSLYLLTYLLVTGARRCDHITPVLRQLHWLPVRQRVEYQVACLVHQSLAGQRPAYIADDIQLVTESDRRQLRSAAARTCLVPRTHNNFGDRSFNAAGPRVWNSLPPHLIQIQIQNKTYNAPYVTRVIRRRGTWTLRVSSVNRKHFYLGVSQRRRIVTVCCFAP